MEFTSMDQRRKDKKHIKTMEIHVVSKKSRSIFEASYLNTSKNLFWYVKLTTYLEREDSQNYFGAFWYQFVIPWQSNTNSNKWPRITQYHAFVGVCPSV